MYLKVIPEELVIQLGDLELVGLLPVHDPGTALPLRVHQHRIPGGPGDHDTILDAQVICGQTLYAQSSCNGFEDDEGATVSQRLPLKLCCSVGDGSFGSSQKLLVRDQDVDCGSYQYLESPLAHFRVVHQELGDLHVLGDRDVQLDTATVEVPGDQQLPELLVEGTKIGDKAGGNSTVTCAKRHQSRKRHTENCNYSM